jgi:hypothetical protein
VSELSSRFQSTQLYVGVLGIVVGIAGIFITLVSFPAALEGIVSVLSDRRVPANYRNAVGSIQLFLIVLLLVLCGFFVGLGLALFLKQIFAALGARRPFPAAIISVAGMLIVAFGCTLVLLEGQGGGPLIMFGIIIFATAAFTQIDDTRGSYG